MSPQSRWACRKLVGQSILRPKRRSLPPKSSDAPAAAGAGRSADADRRPQCQLLHCLSRNATVRPLTDQSPAPLLLPRSARRESIRPLTARPPCRLLRCRSMGATVRPVTAQSPTLLLPRSARQMASLLFHPPRRMGYSNYTYINYARQRRRAPHGASRYCGDDVRTGCITSWIVTSFCSRQATVVRSVS